MENGQNSYEAAVKLDAGIVTRAMTLVMGKGRRPAWVTALVLVLMDALLLAMNRGVWAVVVATMGITLAGMVMLLYYVLVPKQAKQYVESLADGAVHYTASPEGMWSAHHLASSAMRWEIFKRVHKTREMWVLELRGNRAAMPLPLDQVSWEMLCFIESQVVAHGGEVDRDPR